MQTQALTVAGCVFLFVAIMHLVRVSLKSEVKVSGFTVPVWLSAVGAVFAASLAFFMFIAAR